MAILFLWLLVLSIGYHFVMIIPFWVFFFYSWKRSQHSGALVLLSKIALKCCCCPRLRLSSFYLAGREGLKSPEECRGEQAVSGVGSLRAERMWRILHL